MSIATVVLLLVAAVILHAVLAVVTVAAFLIWLARGECDVNGDPERDAGTILQSETNTETHTQ